MRVLEKERDLKGELTVRCDLNLNLKCWAGGFENGSFRGFGDRTVVRVAIGFENRLLPKIKLNK